MDAKPASPQRTTQAAAPSPNRAVATMSALVRSSIRKRKGAEFDHDHDHDHQDHGVRRGLGQLFRKAETRRSAGAAEAEDRNRAASDRNPIRAMVRASRLGVAIPAVSKTGNIRSNPGNRSRNRTWATWTTSACDMAFGASAVAMERILAEAGIRFAPAGIICDPNANRENALWFQKRHTIQQDKDRHHSQRRDKRRRTPPGDRRHEKPPRRRRSACISADPLLTVISPAPAQ